MYVQKVVGQGGEQDLAGYLAWFSQTIEPRLLYVHVPFENQDDLPVFDTILPDLNFVQLFRENRYLGVDRIADTDQLSVGVTSRILESGSGRELFSATIGQARYLSSQNVMLPNEPVTAGDSSDYIAEMYAWCHVALTSYRLDLKSLTEASTLKVREYLLAGLPVFSGHVDSAFPDSFPFYRTSCTPDFSAMREFVATLSNVSRSCIRQTAKPHVDAAKTSRSLYEFALSAVQ